jgi:ABC-type polysaccharide/polyol phosphate export systems, permease component
MEPQPLLILRPATRWNLINLREILQYVDLLSMLALRDVKLRYRQTALGVIWVVLQPLLGAGLFQIVFQLIARTPSDGVPPFVFYYAGFMAYKSFETTLNKASTCMVGNSQLVSKVYFPRMILPFSTVYSTLVDFGVSSVVLAILMAVFRVPPTPAILLAPLWLLLLQVTALGLGLYFSALTVRYRDVQYALPVLIQFGLFASPVAYSVSFILGRLPEFLRPLVYLNPLTGLLDAFRWSVIGTPVYNWGLVGYSVIAAVGLLVAGAMAFSNMEQTFADVI